MRILAMDTATSACSVALWHDGKIVQHRFEAMMRGQAEALAPMVADVLDKAATAAEDLDLLAVSVGPGAFTGLRIGLATARALALASGTPCLGLTTTESIAHAANTNQRPDGTVLVALDSKRSDVYVQAFTIDKQPINEAQAVEPALLGEWLQGITQPIYTIGDAAETVLDALKNEDISIVALDGKDTPDAAAMAALAATRWSPGETLAPPSPLYLRPPDAKLPRNGGRLRP